MISTNWKREWFWKVYKKVIMIGIWIYGDMVQYLMVALDWE